MKMKLIFIFSLIGIVFSQDIKELQLGKVEAVPFQESSVDNVFETFYKVEIPQSNTTSTLNNDFVVVVKGVNLDSHPYVYLSNKNQKPNSRNNSETYCYTFKTTVCTYSGKNLITNSSAEKVYIYIGVICDSSCGFTIETDYDTEKFFDLTDKKIESAYLSFSDRNSEVIKFKGPIISGSWAKKLIISATLTNSLSINSTFYMYLTKGNVPPSSNRFERAGIDTFYQSKSIILREFELSGGFDSNFTILIEADQGSIISLNFQVPGDKKSIIVGEEEKAIISAGDIVIYEINATSTFSQVLTLKFRSFNGISNFFVNENSSPVVLESNKWAIKNEPGSKELVIQKSDLSTSNSVDFSARLFITIQALTTCAYSLVANFGWRRVARLEYNMPEIFKLQPKEIMKIGISRPNEDTMVTLTLDTATPSLQSYVYFVQDLGFHRMNLTENDLQNLTFVATQDGKGSFEFNYKISNCTFWRCHYVLILFQNSTEINPLVSVKLTVSHAPEILEEGVMIRKSIVQRESSNFIFNVLGSANEIDHVEFKFDCIVGQAFLYLNYGSESKYPNPTSFERIATCSFINGIIIKNTTQKVLNTTYFLTVFGSSDVDFALTAFVVRQTPNLTKAIDLLPGYPYNFKFDKDHDGIFFKFKTFALLTNNSEVNIQLTPIVGTFQIYVNKNSAPTLKNYASLTSSNFIQYKFGDSNYESNTTYYVWIRAAPDSNNSKVEEFSFNLLYFNSRTIRELFYGKPTIISSPVAETIHFRLNIAQNVSSRLTFNSLSQSDLESKVNIYIKKSGMNIYPDEKDFDISYFGKTGTINFEQSTVKKDCSKNNTESKYCYWYITVKILSPMRLTLLMTSLNFDFIKIENIIPASLSFENDKPIKLLATVPTNEESIVFAYSAAKHFSLFIKIAKVEREANFEYYNSLLFPNSTDFDLKGNDNSSYFYSSYSIVVNSAKFNETVCKGAFLCHLLISAIPANSSSNFGNQSENELVHFTLSYSVFPLSKGVPLKSSVADKQMQYFSIFVPEPDETIIINVSPLDAGDPDLFVSFGPDSRPTINNFQWSARTFGEAQLLITKNSNVSQSQPGVNGTYVIGVFGSKACQFLLTATYGKYKIISLFAGVPQQISLQKDEPVIFQYSHFSNRNFRISIYKPSGMFSYALSKYVKGENSSFIEVLDPSKAIIKEAFVNQDKILKIQNNSEIFCAFCTYLIKFTSFTNITLNLLIANPMNRVILKETTMLRDLVENGENNYYSFFKPENFPYILTVTKMTGDLKVYAGRSFDLNSTNYEIKEPAFPDTKEIVIKLSDSNKIMKTIWYVMVEAVSNVSEYYISISRTDTKFLKIGFPISFSLQPNASIIYKFNNYQEKEKIYALNIVLNKADLNDVNIEIFNDKLSNCKDCIVENFPKLFSNDTFYNKNASFLNLRNIFANGTVYIKVENKKEKVLNGEARVSDDFSEELVATDSPIVNYLPIKAFKVYEILPGGKGILMIMLNQCGGTIKVSGNSNYQKFSDGENELSTEMSNSITKVLKAPVTDKPFYLKIQADIHNNFGGTTTYTFSKTLNFIPNFKPYEDAIPGNSSSLYWKQEDDSTITLSVEKMKFSDNLNSLNIQPSSIEYFFFASNEENSVDYLFRCRDINFIDTKNDNTHHGTYFVPNNIGFEKPTFKFPTNEGTYYASAMAVVTFNVLGNEMKKMSFNYEYNSITINPSKTSGISVFAWVLIISIVFVAFIAGGCGIYFLRKYKKIEKRLNYELSDVRNVAGISYESGIERKEDEPHHKMVEMD